MRIQADASGRFAAPAAWEVGELSGEQTLIFVGQQSGAVVTTTFTVLPSAVRSSSPTATEATELLTTQHGLQFTFSDVEVARFTIPSLVLSLELCMTGLLAILGGVVLVRLKFRGARTKYRRGQLQERARFVRDREEAQHRAEEREPQQRQQQQACSLPQAAPAVKKSATPAGQRAASLRCPHCGQLMPARATFCSHCGVVLVAWESGQHGRLKLPPSSPPETCASFQGAPSSALPEGLSSWNASFQSLFKAAIDTSCN